MVETKIKPSVICISSSSSSHEDESQEENLSDNESSLSSFIDDDSDFCEEDADGSDSDEFAEDADEEEDDDGGDDDDDEPDEDNQESRYCKVISLLKDRRDLDDLNVKECKAYLRNHGLRMAGTKDVCKQRIIEHWRIKDGNGEALYPKSSFVINCTGDVCKGDVVLFTQKVYKKFDKVTRHGGFQGKRTIAGRVVKESYGAARQQHTFTVEVLWSKGTKLLSPLFPLLVKGRNLYRLRTFRQRWNDEKERVEVLAEKHKRGAAARHIRSLKRTRNTCPAKRDPCQTSKTSGPVQRKHRKSHGKTSSKRSAVRIDHHPVTSRPRQVYENQSMTSIASNNSSRTRGHMRPAQFSRDWHPILHSYGNTPGNSYEPRIQFNNRTMPFYETTSTSYMNRPPSFSPRAESYTTPGFFYEPRIQFDHRTMRPFHVATSTSHMKRPPSYNPQAESYTTSGSYCPSYYRG